VGLTLSTPAPTSASPPSGLGAVARWIRRPDLSGARSLYRWALIGVSVGVIAGFVAIAFFITLTLASHTFLDGLLGISLPVSGAPPTGTYSWSTDPSRFFLLPGLMVAGGLAVGLLIWKGAPEIEGHGTDQAIRAFHRGRGAVRYRVPPLKFLASVLTIGTGGSGGREGPTAQIGSGISTFVARPLGLSTQERRVALMAGVGAGIGAIFKAPFGAALLSSEVLYLSDFEPEVIMPSIIASVISYSIFGAYDGFGPEFATPGVGWTPTELPIFALLGAIAGLLGILYVVTFTRTRELFRRPGIPVWLRPGLGVAIAGGMFAGLYYLVPQENHLLAVGGIGIGYGIVQWFLYQGHLAFAVLVLIAALIFVKMIATSLTVGSGGSAGLFGPAIVIGAIVGFTTVSFVDLAAPSLASPGDVTAFTIIGMMAFFGSVSKAPIATILMVVEMTGSETLLVPAMVAIFIGYYVAGRYHLYSEQVENRLASPAHTAEYFAEFLRRMPVGSALEKDVPTTPVTSSVTDAARALARSPYPVLPVLDGPRLVGEVRLADLLEIAPAARSSTALASAMEQTFPTVSVDGNLLEAVGLMDQEGIDALLVTDPADRAHLVGIVTREGIAHFQRAPGRGATANGNGSGQRP
jgi:chloride channel protein, CIC family